MKSSNLVASLLVLAITPGAPAALAVSGDIDGLAAGGLIQFIEPSGTDDTAALQAALDACSDGTSCLIQLAEGDFYTNTLVAQNFHGVIRGMGSVSTVIRPVPDQPLWITDVDPFWAVDPVPGASYPFLINFIGGRTTVSNLGFNFPDGDFDLTWFACGPLEGWLAGVMVVTGRDRVDFTLRDVSIEAGAGPVLGSNVGNGVFYEGILLAKGAPPPDCAGDPFADVLPNSGRFVAQSNTVSGVVDPLPTAAVESSVIRIEDNLFEGTDWGVDLIDIRNSIVAVTGNTMNVRTVGVSMLQQTPGFTGSSAYFIAKNDITVDTGGEPPFGVGFDGVEYIDFTGESDLFVDIFNNTIELLTPDILDGIYVSGDEGASRVVQNRISGEALSAGIEVDTTTECFVRGNRFPAFMAPVADIYLAANTSACTVIAPQGEVLDEGVDNIIIVP